MLLKLIQLKLILWTFLNSIAKFLKEESYCHGAKDGGYQETGKMNLVLASYGNDLLLNGMR